MPEFAFTIRRTTIATWPFKIEAPSLEAAEQWIDENIVHDSGISAVDERLDRTDATDEITDELIEVHEATSDDRMATGIVVDPDDFESDGYHEDREGMSGNWEPDPHEYGFDPAEITPISGVDYEAN